MTLSLSLQMYETPLFLAALDGREKAVALLLDNGALVNITDSELNSPLHAAAKGGHVGVAALLLERGANPNQPNEVRVRGGARVPGSRSRAQGAAEGVDAARCRTP